jgi:hypothetical protein
VAVAGVEVVVAAGAASVSAEAVGEVASPGGGWVLASVASCGSWSPIGPAGEQLAARIKVKADSSSNLGLVVMPASCLACIRVNGKRGYDSDAPAGPLVPWPVGLS